MAPSVLFLDDAKRKKYALGALLGHLFILHCIFIYMVYVVGTKTGKQYDAATMKIMITSVVGGMGFGLLVLISNDAFDIIKAIVYKWVGAPAPLAQGGTVVTEKKETTTIIPDGGAAATNTVPGDAQINVAGNANITKTSEVVE